MECLKQPRTLLQNSLLSSPVRRLLSPTNRMSNNLRRYPTPPQPLFLVPLYKMVKEVWRLGSKISILVRESPTLLCSNSTRQLVRSLQKPEEATCMGISTRFNKWLSLVKSLSNNSSMIRNKKTNLQRAQYREWTVQVGVDKISNRIQQRISAANSILSFKIKLSVHWTIRNSDPMKTQSSKQTKMSPSAKISTFRTRTEIVSL